MWRSSCRRCSGSAWGARRHHTRGHRVSHGCHARSSGWLVPVAFPRSAAPFVHHWAFHSSPAHRSSGHGVGHAVGTSAPHAPCTPLGVSSMFTLTYSARTRRPPLYTIGRFITHPSQRHLGASSSWQPNPAAAWWSFRLWPVLYLPRIHTPFSLSLSLSLCGGGRGFAVVPLVAAFIVFCFRPGCISLCGGLPADSQHARQASDRIAISTHPIDHSVCLAQIPLFMRYQSLWAPCVPYLSRTVL